MLYNHVGDKTGTLSLSPCPILATYIYTSRKPYFYWTKNKFKVLSSFTGIMPTKSTEIKVAIISRCCQFFPFEELEGTSWLVSSHLLPIFSFPPASYTLLLWMITASKSLMALCCTKMDNSWAAGEGYFILYESSLNRRRQKFNQQLLWIFTRTGTLKLKTHVSFTPCWGDFLMCASSVPKMRVNGSSNCLLSAPPSFLGAVTTETISLSLLTLQGMDYT